MIRQSGVEPEVILYLETPPPRGKLEALIAELEIPPRDLLRRKGTPFEALGLDDPALSDAELIDAMMAHPILINRPIVVTARGTRLCRPAETVMGILDTSDMGVFTKEDGEVINPPASGD